MYPDVPYQGLSWPITQHAGVITETIIRGLISACLMFDGREVDDQVINNYLVSNSLLTANFRADSGQVDAWRDYQQILSEFGLIYSTRVSRKIILTPVAIAFADGDISYQELITLQILRYQYPNGHKSQLSPSLVDSYEYNFTFNSYTELQASHSILVRPAVVVWQTLYGLFERGESDSVTVDELQRYVVRCLRNADVPYCINAIVDSRHSGYSLPALPRARRNMQDWVKLLNITPLFEANSRMNTLSLSQYSIEHAAEIQDICEHLSDPSSFWIYSPANYKMSWFAYYGSIDLGVNLIPKKRSGATVAPPEDDEKDVLRYVSLAGPTHGKQQQLPTDARDVELQSFSPTTLNEIEQHRQIVSIYDYRKSQNGRKLHDNMVNLIAQKCVEKGAEFYYDSSTVDLYVKYEMNDYIVEVKSITPSNFIQRLRYAIGQVNQYDYLLPKTGARRLALAFTATIPSDSWSIPFIKDHLNMDLLYMESRTLVVQSNSSASLQLFG